MARINSYFAIVVMSVVLGGCPSGFKAIYDHDPAHDFSAYQTFAWISPRPMKIGTIKAAVDAILAGFPPP